MKRETKNKEENKKQKNKVFVVLSLKGNLISFVDLTYKL